MNGVDPHWVWLGLGLALAAAEIAVPGFFLIWLAGAALLTGVATWVLPIGFGPQVVLFAMLAMALILIARRIVAKGAVTSADPLMNDRGGRLVGEVVEVTQAIVAGMGRVRQGDGEWLVRGPDAPVGARMKVVGHDGAVLVVEPAG
ncbi:NfeD family protein [Novosphingobium flavum]|uniref:NfeD family protein n=1 Tax=Novosphingobium flavum TaxID=1778672 RepID=A0A7X1KMS7_9SPHN|nr:NfeD family protein [Novosphingobium flavum]MBC2666956.1 NfeD family protein [Novosphingobium flavum]